MDNNYNKKYYEFNNQDRDRLGNLFYSNIIKKNFKIKNYLDFGCGVGFLLKRIEKLTNIKTYGYETNKFAINKCLINTPKSKIYKNIDEIDEKFDLISMVHVVEHISSADLKILLKKLIKKLNYNGKILISTPAKNAFAHNIKKSQWIGFKDPTHINLKDYQEWKEFFESINLKIVKSSNDGLWDFPYKNLFYNLKFFKIFFLMFFQIFFGFLILKHDEGETLILILKNNV
jgi:SAM-dependent methyltransferase